MKITEITIHPKLKSILGIVAFFSLGDVLTNTFGIVGLVLCLPVGILTGLAYGEELYGPWFPKSNEI